MANLFRQIGIYSPVGPALRAGGRRLDAVLPRGARRPAARGRHHRGRRAVARGSPPRPPTACTAAPMLPFYIYYSMFGFQRVGDLIWAAADQRARGFLLGATAGRTTLGGEGLQHQDGSSHVIAATVPNCRAYDPAFACELAVIVDHGMRARCSSSRATSSTTHGDERELRAAVAARGRRAATSSGACTGCSTAPARGAAQVRLLGSGAILREVHRRRRAAGAGLGVAQRSVQRDELHRAGARRARGRALEPPASAAGAATQPRRTQCSAGDAPVVAATDYVRAYPQLIAAYVDAPFTALGTDGFGRSDTRARAAPLLRGRSPPHRRRGADGAGARGDVALRTVAAAIRAYAVDGEVPRRGASDSPEQRRRPRNRIECASPRGVHRVMCIAARPCRLAKSTFPSYCALKEPA